MTLNVDNLVRRLAAILTDIEGMESVDLDHLANSPLPEGDTSGEETKARKMLRGLLRSCRFGHLDILARRPRKRLSSRHRRALTSSTSCHCQMAVLTVSMC